MRYPASEKLEIIRTVETSHLPVRKTLDKIGIPKTTFYAWLDRYASGGFDALEDRKPRPKRVWNRIAEEVRDRIIARALEEPELSPREVAVAFTDAEKTLSLIRHEARNSTTSSCLPMSEAKQLTGWYSMSSPSS